MQNSTNNWRHTAPIIAIAFGLMMSATVALTQNTTIQRPIEDFVHAQGTICFDPPDCFLNYQGWDTLQEAPPQEANVQPLRCALVDYAGLANAKIEELSGGTLTLGTTTSGTVTERPLPSGRAEVTVRLHTTNALTWVIRGENNTCDFAAGPLLFGHRLLDVLVGADAALGESYLQVKFVNTAPGAPLPDLLKIINTPGEDGQEFPSFISLTARADGTLRGNFGVPDGTLGRAEVIQTGLFMTTFMGATGDAFPAERITLDVTGQ